MRLIVKYSVLAGGLLVVLVVALSGALALAENFGGMMGRGCMRMMQSMPGGTGQPPNQQWRQPR